MIKPLTLPPREAKAEEVKAAAGIVPAAARHAGDLRGVDPAAAAEDPAET